MVRIVEVKNVSKQNKKVKIKWKNLFSLVLVGLVIGVALSFLINPNKAARAYLKGSESRIEAYDEEGNLVDNFARGLEVSKSPNTKTIEDTTYVETIIEGKKYLIKEANITSDKNQVVEEKERYIRTTYHLLKEELDGSLLDLLTKGSKIEIKGYRTLLEDGSVDYYKVDVNGVEGYFPSKYTVGTEEEAKKNYDEEGTYKIHLNRGNVYGGGSASKADYYPVDKPKFSDNVMPEEVRSFYLNGTKQVMSRVDEYIALAREGNINAFVVDIKDSGVPCYESEVMKNDSPTNYKYAQQSLEEYRTAIKKLKDAGFYVIGRISAFKDKYYAIDHPEYTILETKTGKPYYLAESYWPTAYSREVWKFNVDLAKEAVKEMGFNEIQFDYVRFPDRVITLERNGLIDFRNTYNEDKIEAVQRFLMYATNELHALGVYVSADVFGESAHTYVTAYGQYWPAISNVVDVISGMPYPDHFSTYEYGFKEPVWTMPYDILNYWGSNFVAKRQQEIPTPAIARTWIQTYDSIKSPKVVYGAAEVEKEIRGLYDAGLTGGYMTWNSGSNINKFRSQIAAYSKEYLK